MCVQRLHWEPCESPAGMSISLADQGVHRGWGTWLRSHEWLVLRTRARNSQFKALTWAAVLPTGKVCIQRLRLEVSFMGILEGAKGLISALWGVHPPGRTCSMDSALPTWNLPGALESRWGGSIMFSRTSAGHHGVEQTQSTKPQWNQNLVDGRVKASKNLGHHKYQK